MIDRAPVFLWLSGSFRRLKAVWILLTLTPPCFASSPTTLNPAAPIERRLEDGASHLYSAELTPGVWRVTVERRGIDVTVEAHDSDGAHLAVADLPFERLGREILLLEPDVAMTVELEVRTKGIGVDPRSYILALERLKVEPRRLEAERAMAQAAAATAQDKDAGYRDAVEQLESAASIWQELGEFRRETEALHALGLVHQKLKGHNTAFAKLELAQAGWQQLDELLFVASALHDAGSSLLELDRHDDAGTLFEQSVALFAKLGELPYEAEARTLLCYVYQSRGDLQRAERCYREAFDLLEASPDRRLENRLHNNLGGIYYRLGEPDLARRHLLVALDLRRENGNREREAVTLTNLASLDRSTGRWHEALEHWGRALELFRDLGDRRKEATVFNSLGFAYLQLGELERARAFFLEALPLRQAVEDRYGEAITLNHLSTVHRRLGALPAARAGRQQVLALRRELEDRRGEASTLAELGRDHLNEGNSDEALEHFDAALVLFETDVDDPRQAAWAGSGRGKALVDLGHVEDAAAVLEAALDRHREHHDRAGEVATRVTLAELERRRGRIETALEHTTEAIEQVEELRGTIPLPQLRATFLASRSRAYELRIDLLVELAHRDGTPVHLRTALAAAERTRARALLDLLAESQIDPAQGVDSRLRQRRRTLLDRLHLAAKRQQPADALIVELDLVEAEIRRLNPAYAELTHPEPLDADGLQKLLDEDVTLLQYALGEERSILWRVTRFELEAHVLPPRATVEELARRAHSELATVEVGAPRHGPSALEELAAMVLGPVAAKLEGGRLAIVADGALTYVPFAALPSPGDDREPLVTRFEVVHLPSASALDSQRRRPRPAPRRAAVVLADPIFDALDLRVATVDNAPAGNRDLSHYPRLPSSRLEAEALRALLSRDEVRTVLDAEASRQTVLDGVLGNARVVHLATHGLIDAARPELSGLVLSRVDVDGRPRDGFLALRDVYELDLAAELVVLSGCRTALGKEVRGEGLMGLTHGFFHAGAERVLASLWQVEDRATAALMAAFYESLFVNRRRPAEALRNAQLKVRAERRWRHPSYWAGFVLQGDWR